jgi:hypothetical protein
MPAIASGIHCVIAYIGATLEISRVLSQETAKVSAITGQLGRADG